MLFLVSSLALAAEGHGGEEAHGIPWDTIAFQSVSFVIFLGLLYWFARRPIGDAVRRLRCYLIRKA